MNSWLWDFSDEPVFKSFRSLINSPLTSFLYKQMNFSAKYLLPKSFGKRKLPKKILKQYTSPFANSSQRNGTLAFARSLLNDQQWFEMLWQKTQMLQQKPVLFIWGMIDKFVRPSFLDKFVKGFPQSSSLKLVDCGHFPQEENPSAVAQSIKAFLRK